MSFECGSISGLPFWPITQGQDELQEEECQVDILQNCVENSSSRIAKRKRSLPISLSGSTDEIHDNAGREPK